LLGLLPVLLLLLLDQVLQLLVLLDQLHVAKAIHIVASWL